MDKKAYEISVNRVLSKQAWEMPTWDQAKGWMGRNADYLVGAGGMALLTALLGKKKNFWRNLLTGGIFGAAAVGGARALGLDKYWNKPNEDPKPDTKPQNKVPDTGGQTGSNVAKGNNIGVNKLIQLNKNPSPSGDMVKRLSGNINSIFGDIKRSTGDYYSDNPRDFDLNNLNYGSDENDSVWDPINNGDVIVGYGFK